MGPAGGFGGMGDCGYGGGDFGGYHAAAPSYAPSYAPTHVATTPAPMPTQQVGYQGYPSAQGYYPAYWYGN